MRYVAAFRFSAAALVAGLLAACGGPQNYAEAHLRVVDGKQFVLLKGRRLLMAHDPVSALQRKTYEDSVLLPLPVADGVIRGQDIPTKPGYYTYGGEIRRKKESVVVRLHFNNNDDKVTDPLGWNGEYELVSR